MRGRGTKEFEILTQDRVKQILRKFKKEIEAIIKGKLVELVLFGSYARGDYEFGSDIDVLLIVSEVLGKEEKDRISETASKLSLKYDTVISNFEYLYENFVKDETPFLMNVRKEGIRI
jgi:predicted nucleotidyltransferase